MGDVTKSDGRTILFVSHNLTAVKELCKSGILLDQGRMIYSGGVEESVIEYQKSSLTKSSYVHEGKMEEALGNENIRILEFSAAPEKGQLIDIDSGVKVKLKFFNNSPNINLDTTFELRTFEEVVVFHTGAFITQNNDSEKRVYEVDFVIPAQLLNAGNYYFKIIFGKDQRDALYINENIVSFEVENIKLGNNISVLPGLVRPVFDYKVN